MTTESKPSPGNSLFVILFKSDNDLHGLYKSEINSIFLPYKGETGLSHTSRAQIFFFLGRGRTLFILGSLGQRSRSPLL
jgi:hypothetical protein